MDVKVEEKGTLTRIVHVTVPADEVQKNLEKSYAKLQKESKMKGFRRGKVPRSIIEKSYKPKVELEIAERFVQDTCMDAVKQENLDIAVQPEIINHGYNEDGTFSYEVEVDLKPSFTPEGYKGLEIESADTEVTDGDIDLELEGMRKHGAALRKAERPAAAGDIVEIDFQGYYNGNLMKQIHGENSSVEIGSGQLEKELEDKLIGMTEGEEATHEVSFPEKHPNQLLAGKTVEFKVTVKDVKERVLPECDDEFAKDFGADSLEELKTTVKERIAARKKKMADDNVVERLMHALIEKNEFEVPKRLVDFEVEHMVKQMEQQFQQSGMTLEAAGISRDTLVEQNKESAEKRVRGDFILKKIAEVEEIKLDDEDMNKAFDRIAKQYKISIAQVKEYFQNREDLLPLVNDLLNEKVLDFLRGEAKILEPAAVSEVEAES